MMAFIITLAFSACATSDDGSGDVDGDNNVADGDDSENDAESSDGDAELLPGDEDGDAAENVEAEPDEEVVNDCGNSVCDEDESGETCPEDCWKDGRRGSADDLPEEMVTCEEGCQKMQDCGHLGVQYSLIEDYSHCVSLCSSADNLPVGGQNTSDDNFRRCTFQDDCEALKFCGDWLKDPRLTITCSAVCECVSEYMDEDLPAQAWLGADLEMLAPQHYKPARDVVVLRNLSSIDIPTTLNDLGISAELEGKGVYAKLRATGLTTPQAMRKLADNIELLPTFKDAAGHIVATTEKLVITPLESSKAGVTAKLASYGLKAVAPVKWSKTRWFADAATPIEALKIAKAINFGSEMKAELNMVRYYAPLYAPNDEYYPQQWHLKNSGLNESIANVDGRVWEAWELTTGITDEEHGSTPVEIGIFDDGCDLKQPDLMDKMQDPIEFPEDWEDRMEDLFGWHGSSVAGVAAAQGNNEIGVAGVCPDCTLRCSQALSETGNFGSSGITDEDVGRRYQTFADQGSAVINNSWGPAGGDPYIWDDDYTIPALPSLITDAFNYCETSGRDGKGTLIVFAAGNGNQPLSPNEYAAYTTNVAVGAVDDQGLKSIYSTYGLQLDISAPSNGGLNGIVTTAARGYGDMPDDENYTRSFGGTSSASPFVSGVIGLILAANPDLTAAEVRDILKRSARKIDQLGGLYDEEGHSIYYGYGLVDAYVAVKMALDPVTCTDRESCLATSDICEYPPDKSFECNMGPCSVCSDNTQCASGVCQSLPALGISVCIAPCGEDDSCLDDYTCQSGYCVPSREACGLCDTPPEETCNGRDDNCDGSVDGTEICAEKGIERMCFSDADCPALEDGTITHCLARTCHAECDTTDECLAYNEEYECMQPAYRYGAVEPDHKVCMTTSSISAEDCSDWCNLMICDESEDKMAQVIECVEAEIDFEDEEVDCVGIYLNCLDLIM